MEPKRCCVCDVALRQDEGHRIGARHFCRDHFARAMAATRARWSRSGLLEIAAVILFVGLAGLGGGTAGEGALPTSTAVGVLLALLPALVLMVYVYRQDRIEPEPWGLVGGVFLLGALLGHAVASPVAQDWFGVGDWEHLSPTAGWIASVLVVGTLQQLCGYVAVRYTVYLTDEFDEPADGLVYASAAGLGIATAANVAFVLRNDGVVPLSGAAHIATNCLIHLAAAAALGYGLGRNRFLGHPRQLWLGGAFLLSVLINGGLKQLAVRAGIDGGTFRPWVSLTVAVVVVAIILVAIDALMARLSFENFAKPVGARPAEGSRKEAASP